MEVFEKCGLEINFSKTTNLVVVELGTDVNIDGKTTEYVKKIWVSQNTSIEGRIQILKNCSQNKCKRQ